jgi:hypothetical protein
MPKRGTSHHPQWTSPWKPGITPYQPHHKGGPNQNFINTPENCKLALVTMEYANSRKFLSLPLCKETNFFLDRERKELSIKRNRDATT